MKYRTASLVIALLCAVLVGGVSSAAQAQDRHPCVSKREFNGAHVQTRQNLEERWEVVGLGRPLSGSGLAFPATYVGVMYPRCGFPESVAFYGVLYQRRGRHLWVDYLVKGHYHNGRYQLAA